MKELYTVILKVFSVGFAFYGMLSAPWILLAEAETPLFGALYTPFIQLPAFYKALSIILLPPISAVASMIIYVHADNLEQKLLRLKETTR